MFSFLLIFYLFFLFCCQQQFLKHKKILIYLILPLCFKIKEKLNKKTFLIISISLVSIFLLDEIYNLILTKIFDLPRAIDIYKSIGIHFM